MTNGILALIAWAVCIALFLLQGLFGAVITFSMLGHLSQILSKDRRSELGKEQ